jgi:hypothetical protein
MHGEKNFFILAVSSTITCSSAGICDRDDWAALSCCDLKSSIQILDEGLLLLHPCIDSWQTVSQNLEKRTVVVTMRPKQMCHSPTIPATQTFDRDNSLCFSRSSMTYTTWQMFAAIIMCSFPWRRLRQTTPFINTLACKLPVRIIHVKRHGAEGSSIGYLLLTAYTSFF